MDRLEKEFAELAGRDTEPTTLLPGLVGLPGYLEDELVQPNEIGNIPVQTIKDYVHGLLRDENPSARQLSELITILVAVQLASQSRSENLRARNEIDRFSGWAPIFIIIFSLFSEAAAKYLERERKATQHALAAHKIDMLNRQCKQAYATVAYQLHPRAAEIEELMRQIGRFEDLLEAIQDGYRNRIPLNVEPMVTALTEEGLLKADEIVRDKDDEQLTVSLLGLVNGKIAALQSEIKAILASDGQEMVTLPENIGEDDSAAAAVEHRLPQEVGQSQS